MHPGQLHVTVTTVQRLVASQMPRWAPLPVTAVASTGTVNAVFRLGEELSVRVPLQAGEPRSVRVQLEAEAAAGRELHGRTPFPTPEPLAVGEPGEGCPVPWSVQTWLPGMDATQDDPGGSVAFAEDLAAFISAVRGLPTRGRTFLGTGRGGDLTAHDDYLATCFERGEGLLDVAPARRLWNELRETPRDAPDAMTHGDLMPGNVLVAEGRLAGILDVGGLGPADPALELVGAWHLLETAPRAVLRAALAIDDDEWARGRGWALQQAMGLVWYYAESNPVMSAIGRRTLGRLLAGD